MGSHQIKYNGYDYTYSEAELLHFLLKIPEINPTEEVGLQQVSGIQRMIDSIMEFITGSTSTKQLPRPDIDVYNHYHVAIFEAFKDHYSKHNKTTYDDRGEIVKRPPRLIRILHSHLVDAPALENIVNMIVEHINFVHDALIDKLDIYIRLNKDLSQGNNECIVHVGVDFEEIYLRRDENGMAENTLRTNRGSESLSQ